MNPEDKKFLLMSKTFKVDSKFNERVFFNLNDVQKQIHSQSGHWTIEVKPRQVGSTTFWALNFFMDILIYSPMSLAIVSHEDEATMRLLNKIDTVYRNLPEEFKPAIKHDSTHEKSFPEIGSAVYIGTAGSRKFGRGDTFGRVILSEYAHWGDDQAKNIRVGIQEGCKAGKLVIESTPYGEGNEFHNLYLAAKEGRTPYTPVFIPWFWMGEYNYPPDHPLVRRSEDKLESLILSPEEDMLVKSYKLTENQLRFRRVTMQSMSPNDEKEARSLFLQEYPEDDVSCFASISDAVFSLNALSSLQPQDPVEIQDSILWWGKPLPGRSYVVGADCSTGFGKDSSVGMALDVTDYPKVFEVGRFSGILRDDEFAQVLAKMGERLFKAPLVVEANDVGQSVLNSLINYMRYPNVFYQADPSTGELKQRPGYLTTHASKRILVNGGKRVIDSGYLHTYDKELIKQLRFFRRYPDGTIGASPGTHDDFVMALLLGIRGSEETPRLSGKKSQAYGYRW